MNLLYDIFSWKSIHSKQFWHRRAEITAREYLVFGAYSIYNGTITDNVGLDEEYSMKKKFIMAIVLIICLLCSTACGGQAGGVSDTGGNPYPGTPETDMVTVDIQTEPLALNSMATSDSVTGIILRMSMVGLMKLDGQGNAVPGAAESVEVSDDKKTYTFHLRKDMQWSSGEPVTAQDFVFAWTTMLDPQTAAPDAYVLWENIVNAQDIYEGKKPADALGAVALDDYTLQVELLDPIPYALDLFAQSNLLPINQKAYEAIGGNLYGTDADKLVTNGAYRVVEWVHDSYVLMEKNDNYYDADNIKVPKVKYVMLGDENSRINAFKSGQLDMFDIFGEQIALLGKESEKIVNAYYDNTVFCFQFNQNRSATANPKISRALTMAIDIQSLCDNVFQDGSLPADGMTPPSIPGADGESFAEARGSLMAYDPEEAKKLFEEGLKELGTDAKSLKLTYTAENSSIGKLQAEYFQQQWEKNLGLKVEVELMDWAALLQVQQNGQFDFTFSGWNSGMEDPIGYLNTFVSDNNNNVGSYADPAYDALIVQAKQESDPLKRQEYLIQAEQMLADSGAVLPLYFTRIVYASSAKVTGVVCTSFQKYDFTAGAEIVK